MENKNLSVALAALLLNDAGKDITVEAIKKILDAASIKINAQWVEGITKTLGIKSVDEFADNFSCGAAVASAPSATATTTEVQETKEEKVEEEEEEEDFGGFGDLF
ncbi:60S acidic ribosomal protein P1 [Entamoeba marina]